MTEQHTEKLAPPLPLPDLDGPRRPEVERRAEDAQSQPGKEEE
jgi:hypothetical protein